MADPFASRFNSARTVEALVVNAPSFKNDESPLSVDLTAVESKSVLVGVVYSALLVYSEAVDFERLKTAVAQLAELQPQLAGRVNADAPQIRVDCNNKGIPLTLVDWSEGRVDNVLVAKGFDSWETSLPSHPSPPVFVDDMNGVQVAFEGQAPLKLRLTNLGDGGCVLATTCWHGLLDGTRLAAVLGDLASIYRGEAMPIRSVSRAALTAEGLAKLLPNGEQVVRDAITAIQGGEEDKEPNYKEAFLRTHKHNDVANSFWKSAPEAPQGLRHITNTVLHLPRKDLENLQQALQDDLKAASDGISGARLSKFDIAAGIVWCLRRIAVGSPLPGQEKAYLRDLVLPIVDLAYNVLPKGALDDFVGNAMIPMPLVLPPSEEGAGKDYTADAVEDAAAWRKAIALVAATNRGALEGFRNGGGQQALLETVVVPNKIQKDFDFFNGIVLDRTNPGVCTLRTLITSWQRFALHRIDFGAGPPQQIMPYWHTVQEIITVVTDAPDNDGMYLHVTLPNEVLSHTGLQQVVPNAKFLLA